jgi:uncharacterized membrane protein (DUF373 family)
MSKLNPWKAPFVIKTLFNRTIDAVFAVILLFITLTMIIGVVRLFFRLGELMQEGGITGNYLYIFSDVLTLFILIELSRSLVDYFSTHKLPMTPIIDAGIVFVLRHIMIELFNHKLDNSGIYAMSALLLTLGVVRISTTSEMWLGRRKAPVVENTLQ